MRFLVCGLGSIGQRHVRILRRLLGEAAEISAYRVRNLALVIGDDLQAQFGETPEARYGLQAFFRLDEALDQELDAVLVTNPISMHLGVTRAAAERGHNLFVEKPLAHTMKGVPELLRLTEQKGLVTLVGYQLRFHPALIAIKAYLKERLIGHVVSAHVHFGEWLPGMHPYEDYRESHAARRDQGGGVLLCLSHELDYACWLFGHPATVRASGGHLSDLELDVEDTASIILECEQDGRTVLVNVYLDFIQRPPSRFCKIVGERGVIHWDYYTNMLTLDRSDRGETRRTTFDNFQRNAMFLAEMRHFLACLKGEEASLIPLREGAATLEVCLAARSALESGQTVVLPSTLPGAATP